MSEQLFAAIPDDEGEEEESNEGSFEGKSRIAGKDDETNESGESDKLVHVSPLAATAAPLFARSGE